jgi:hypothetical protein
VETEFWNSVLRFSKYTDRRGDEHASSNSKNKMDGSEEVATKVIILSITGVAPRLGTARSIPLLIYFWELCWIWFQ